MSKLLAWTFSVAGMVLAIGAVEACVPFGGDSTPPDDAGFDASMEAAATDGRADASDATSGDAKADVRADACSFTAGHFFLACNLNGQCVDVTTDYSNCGACGNLCTSGALCSNGMCLCPGAEFFCAPTMSFPTGQCVDLLTDSINCGACGALCLQGAICQSGVCTFPGSLYDPNNCGSFGTVCSAGVGCQGGVCSCAGATSMCAGRCADTNRDPNNCAACGNHCPAGEVCANGACVCTVPVPDIAAICGGACDDLTIDSNNCGMCAKRCPVSTHCSGGTCVCPPSLSLCSGTCVDETNDSANCGACGMTCPLGKTCIGGACDCMTATTGLTMCGSACVPLLTDANNCGVCGKQCPPGDSCQNGQCTACPGAATQCGAQLIFVNAIGSQKPLRMCWALGGSLTSDVPFPSGFPMPASNYAGIPIGGAAWLDGTRSATLVSQGATLYAVNASELGMTDPPCDQLKLTCSAGATCWRVGSIVADPLHADQVYVAAIEGCLGAMLDPNANQARCGLDWDRGNGNLHLDMLVIPNSNSPPDGGVWSIQAAQLSPGLASLIGDAGTTLVTYGTDAGSDAGAFAQLSGEGTIAPPLPAMLTAPSMAQFDQLGFAVAVQGVDAGSAGQLWMSLAQAAQLVAPTQDPNVYYRSTGTYLVAILGDPNGVHAFDAPTDAGLYNGSGLHVLVLPPRAP
jgi:hypothetical protein